MTALAHRRPHVLNPRRLILKPKNEGTVTQLDGSMLVTLEQLERFGNGNADRGRSELRLLLALERDGPVLSGPVERPQNVRIAGPQDEEALLKLLLIDLKENAEHIAPIDEEKVREQIRAGTRKRGGITACIDVGGVPVAVMIFIPAQWWWSQGWYWFEVVNFVHPDHRRSRFASDLMDFAKYCTDDNTRKLGFPWYFVCGVLGAWRVRAKIALYRRKFLQAGAAFVYPAPPMRGN